MKKLQYNLNDNFTEIETSLGFSKNLKTNLFIEFKLANSVCVFQNNFKKFNLSWVA